MTVSEKVKAAAIAAGFDSVGITQPSRLAGEDHFDAWLRAGMHGEMGYLERNRPVRLNPELILPGVRSMIVVTLGYVPSTSLDTDAKISKYAYGQDYHEVLKSRLRRATREWQGILPEAKFRHCVDSAPLFEREYAHQAGLGWFGKNTCLIDSRRGSFFFIGISLTTADLDPDQPSPGGCGTCRACIDACPTGAIVNLNGRWSVDARTCISYLTIEKRGSLSEEEARQVGEWTFGCDVCQDVCPFNQPRPNQPLRAHPHTVEEFSPRSFPTLARLAVINDSEFDQFFKNSAITRTGAEALRRNAQANLENRSPKSTET